MKRTYHKVEKKSNHEYLKAKKTIQDSWNKSHGKKAKSEKTVKLDTNK